MPCKLDSGNLICFEPRKDTKCFSKY
jgi:hypothetical protein